MQILFVWAISQNLSTIACSLVIFASALVGWAGILLNNRGSFVVIYTFLVFIFILIPGYMAYKRHAEGKVNAQWSQSLSAPGVPAAHCHGFAFNLAIIRFVVIARLPALLPRFRGL